MRDREFRIPCCHCHCSYCWCLERLWLWLMNNCPPFRQCMVWTIDTHM